MYIDDCTVFGDTNIEFVSRLKLIFERFKKHNLYVSEHSAATYLLKILLLL